MFISQLTFTSGFGDLHFVIELVISGATKEGDNFSCTTVQIDKCFANRV